MRSISVQTLLALTLANGVAEAHPGHALDVGMSGFAHAFGIHTNLAFVNAEAVMPALGLLLGAVLVATFPRAQGRVKGLSVLGTVISVLSAGLLLAT
ncbi:MAG: hypothetical protein H6981_00570 [Gammaproteobacteria bacterium]|nr:hypothetical protein [Gammaproteobacteria bacterium]